MGSPYTIATLNDVPAATTENLLTGLRGRVLANPSRVQIALNSELATDRVSVLVGSDNVLDNGRVTTVAGGGIMPVLPDDNVITTFGNAQDEIIINGFNSAGAASEIRAIVRVTEIDDVALAKAMAEADIQ